LRLWIIALLNGVSKESYSLLQIEYLQQRELVNTYRAREESLLSQLKEEKEEKNRLQEIIFRNFGIRLNDEIDPIPPSEDINPINTSPGRVSQVLRSMERDDRRRVENVNKAQKEAI